jgi:hypothetical protein
MKQTDAMPMRTQRAGDGQTSGGRFADLEAKTKSLSASHHSL